MTSATRPGFSLVELLIVVVLVGLLAAIAVPAYQKVMYRVRAVQIVGDMRAVRTAAYEYHAAEGTWHPDTYEAVFPSGLRPYVSGVEFEGPGYELDWDNWSMPEGEHVLGISVFVQDSLLEMALISTLGTVEGTFVRLGSRYTYVIESW